MSELSHVTETRVTARSSPLAAGTDAQLASILPLIRHAISFLVSTYIDSICALEQSLCSRCSGSMLANYTDDHIVLTAALKGDHTAEFDPKGLRNVNMMHACHAGVLIHRLCSLVHRHYKTSHPRLPLKLHPKEGSLWPNTSWLGQTGQLSQRHLLCCSPKSISADTCTMTNASQHKVLSVCLPSSCLLVLLNKMPPRRGHALANVWPSLGFPCHMCLPSSCRAGALAEHSHFSPL